MNILTLHTPTFSPSFGSQQFSELATCSHRGTTHRRKETLVPSKTVIILLEEAVTLSTI